MWNCHTTATPKSQPSNIFDQQQVIKSKTNSVRNFLSRTESENVFLPHIIQYTKTITLWFLHILFLYVRLSQNN